jgi:hypothetical protein
MEAIGEPIPRVAAPESAVNVRRVVRMVILTIKEIWEKSLGRPVRR